MCFGLAAHRAEQESRQMAADVVGRPARGACRGMPVPGLFDPGNGGDRGGLRLFAGLRTGLLGLVAMVLAGCARAAAATFATLTALLVTPAGAIVAARFASIAVGRGAS